MPRAGRTPELGWAVAGCHSLHRRERRCTYGMILIFTRSRAGPGEKLRKAMVTLTWEVYVAA